MSASDDFEFSISRKAPAFLDAQGLPVSPDPLAEAWKDLVAGFAQLHAQRMLELMHRLLHEMPADERLFLEWEDDETSQFYLRFSNGWSLGAWFEGPDEPSHRYTNVSRSIAPAWFPRDMEGQKRWEEWRHLLCGSTIDTAVDNVPQQALEQLSLATGGLHRGLLPTIAETLIGPEWKACLDGMAIEQATSMTGPAKKPRKRL